MLYWGHNDKGVVMGFVLCPECKAEVPEHTAACPKCGRTFKATPVVKKPIIGLVVAAILGAIGLWWALSSFMAGAIDPALCAIMPALAPCTLLNASVNSLGNSILLIGVVLTAFGHQKGPRIIRITCILMLVATILLGGWLFSLVWMYSLVSGSLNAMEPQFRAGFVAGIIGSSTGGIFVWGVIAIFFRKSRTW